MQGQAITSTDFKQWQYDKWEVSSFQADNVWMPVGDYNRRCTSDYINQQRWLGQAQEENRKKEKTIEKKRSKKAKESLVKASYYWEIYYSDVCLKGKHSIFCKMFGGLKSESAKLEALKENIRMQVIGMG